MDDEDNGVLDDEDDTLDIVEPDDVCEEYELSVDEEDNEDCDVASPCVEDDDNDDDDDGDDDDDDNESVDKDDDEELVEDDELEELDDVLNVAEDSELDVRFSEDEVADTSVDADEGDDEDEDDTSLVSV